MPAKLRWGIIGCGNVVEYKSGPSIQQAGNSTIVGVMRRKKEKARVYAQKCGIPFWTDKAKEIMKNPEVDIVYVATPPGSHRGYVLDAAAAGKHVLVEKPMALNAFQANEMIQACKKAGIHLFVAYYRRFHPHVQKMREIIESGLIGNPIQAFIDISANVKHGNRKDWRELPEISGGGRFIDFGSHRIDLIVYLFGKIEEASGTITTFDKQCRVEQTASLWIRFSSGAQCAVIGDFYSGRVADKFLIIGATGSIIADPLDGHSFVVTTKKGQQDFSFKKFPAPHLGLIRHIERVITSGEKNLSSGEDGLITEEILDKTVRSPLGIL